jgi:hypothetical protein
MQVKERADFAVKIVQIAQINYKRRSSFVTAPQKGKRGATAPLVLIISETFV